MKVHGSVLVIVAVLLFASPVAVAQDNATELVTLEGKVVDSEGKPVEGAAIYLAIRDNWSFIKNGYGKTQVTPTLLGTSRSDGTFRVSANRHDIAAQHVSNATLIALPSQGSGLGVDWAAASAFNIENAKLPKSAEQPPAAARESAASRELRLAPDDVPIDGRIVHENGAPVVGARIRVFNIQQLRNDDLSGLLAVAQRGNPRDYDIARIDNVTKSYFGELGRRDGFGNLLTATTDDDGRFSLQRFGRNRLGWLMIEHDQVVTDRVLVRTEAGPSLAMRDGDALFTLYPARFEHKSITSRPIEGTIVDQGSGEPIAGALIENIHLYPRRGDLKRVMHQGDCSAMTNERGWFRLTGLPTGHPNLTLLITAQHSPHLPRFHTIEIPQGDAIASAVDLRLRLRRGEWIEGRVSNSQTNRPVWCHLHYFVFRDNSHAASAPGFEGTLSYPARPPYMTDIDGKYRIPALPGRGIVTAKVISDASASRYCPNRGQEGIKGAVHSGIWSNFDTLPSECRVSTFHGVREVLVSEGQRLLAQDFALSPSIKLTGVVLDPDGQPLLGSKYAGTDVKNFYMHPLSGSGFEVFDYDPAYARRLLFSHLERQLAATVVLEGEQSSPLQVRLRPAGSLVGRVVDDDGVPLPSVVLDGAPFAAPNPPTTITALPEPNYTTDQAGRFRIDGLAPGMQYSLKARIGNRLRVVVLNATVESGQTTDVGDVKPKPLEVLRTQK